MRNRTRTRLLKRLVLGLAIVAVAAPVAQARPEGAGAPSNESVQGVTGFSSSAGVEYNIWPVDGNSPARADDKVRLVGGADIWQLTGAPEQVTGTPVHADDKIGLQPSTSPRLVAHPDNRADRTGPGFEGAGSDVTLVGHPDNRADRTGPGYEGTGGAERAYRGTLPSDYGQPNVIVAVDRTGDGFDWGDAGIGAGTLFGIVLLAGGAFVLTRHLSRPATA
jgi:hypothetical protein